MSRRKQSKPRHVDESLDLVPVETFGGRDNEEDRVATFLKESNGCVDGGDREGMNPIADNGE